MDRARLGRCAGPAITLLRKGHSMPTKIPEHWGKATWEEKARENPLLAVMTTKDMTDAPPTDFGEDTLEVFFRKGRSLFDLYLRPLLSRLPGPKENTFVAEYGC